MGFILWPAPLTWPFFINKEIFVDDFWNCGTTHRRLKGGGDQGCHAPPPNAWQKWQNGPICNILHDQIKNFLRGMPPAPPNSLISSVFLALAAAGPLQWECLEPPVAWTAIQFKVTLLQWLRCGEKYLMNDLYNHHTGKYQIMALIHYWMTFFIVKSNFVKIVSYFQFFWNSLTFKKFL